MKKISFVSVNYKNHLVTLDLCRSLESQDGLGEHFELECILVDNSESAEQLEALNDFNFPTIDIKVVGANRNLGYFGGLNLGLSEASSDFVVICNNDLKFQRDFCIKLLSSKYEEPILAIAPDVITIDGYHQNPHVLSPIGWLRRFQFDLYYTNYFVAKLMVRILAVFRPTRRVLPILEEGCEIHMGIGACYILLPAFLKKFSNLDYPQFLYGEEAYFSKQIHDAGGVLWYEPKLRVVHAESVSTAKIPRRQIYEYAKEGYPDYRGML